MHWSIRKNPLKAFICHWFHIKWAQMSRNLKFVHLQLWNLYRTLNRRIHLLLPGYFFTKYHQLSDLGPYRIYSTIHVGCWRSVILQQLFWQNYLAPLLKFTNANACNSLDQCDYYQNCNRMLLLNALLTYICNAFRIIWTSSWQNRKYFSVHHSLCVQFPCRRIFI